MTNDRATGAGISLAPGTKVGKYEIVEMLAVGGQAVVYKARDPLLDRLVAVKQISSTLAADPAFLERFRREAKILAKLGADEPGIVTVHELIESAEGLFIVMEYLDGITVERSLEDNPGPVEVRAVLAILWRLAAAMNAVHKAGIIHRDLKPSNLVISEGLRVTITDFGVAASSTGQTSMLLGTTKYMAPELFTGQSVDARVDIYSLGLVIYEMLIGRAKFREVFADVVRDPHSESLRWMKWHGNLSVQAPPACEINPNVPRALSDMVVRMMAKKVEERYPSMEALGRAIKQNFGGRGRGLAGAAAGGGAAEPMPGGHSVLDEESAVVARPVSGKAPPRAEPKETATAPLPKKKLPLRTKLILAGSCFVVLLGLGVFMALSSGSKQQRAIDEARALLAQGKGHFVKEAYAPAKDQFSRVAAVPGQYPELQEVKAQAHVMETLCQGFLHVESREWDAAASKCGQVEKRLQEIQREYKSPDMVRWTKDELDRQESALGKLERQNKESKAFHEKLREAKTAFDNRKYDQVRELLGRESMNKFTLGNVLKSLVAEKDELLRKAEHEMTGEATNEAVREADQLAGEKKYKEALIAYRRARERVTATRGLTAEEQAALLKSVDAKIQEMSTEENYQTLMAQAETARQQGLPDKELEALQQAQKVKPSDEVTARIAKLQKAVDEAAAKTVVNDISRPSEDRIKAVEAFIAKYPDDPWGKPLLENLKNEGVRRDLMARGTAAFDAKDWAKALEAFEAAAKIMADTPVKDKIKECQYQLQMEKARALFTEEKYEEALAEVEKAGAANPAHQAEAQAFQAEITAVKNFKLLMQRAADALKGQSFGQAKEALERAKKLMPSRAGEVDVMLKKVEYRQLVSQGDDAMATESFTSARFMYERAQKIEDTEEVRRKLEAVRAKLGGS
ncbi:MAG: protein kinase [Planctomycetota bacterium]|nr:protein kinase [Planctomycetota bacterium]